LMQPRAPMIEGRIALEPPAAWSWSREWPARFEKAENPPRGLPIGRASDGPRFAKPA
jgi:hypothetical protein